MMSPEAATVALRLDPTLVPPNGCWVRNAGGTVGKVTNVFLLDEDYTSPVTVRVLVGDERYEIWFPERVTEIVELPDDCPPLSEWGHTRAEPWRCPYG